MLFVDLGTTDVRSADLKEELAGNSRLGRREASCANNSWALPQTRQQSARSPGAVVGGGSGGCAWGIAGLTSGRLASQESTQASRDEEFVHLPE